MPIDVVGSVSQASFAPGTAAPAAPSPARVAPSPVTDAQLNEAIAAANKSVASHGSSVEFSIDAKHGTTIVRVTDTITGQLIRQMPSAEMIEIAKALDQFQGMLIRRKA
jgi:flagellar protein FlaG